MKAGGHVTTNSMGRLTLNVLLSFAQFEREVISERIRDKVAASKARGMWMGGPVALGYRVEERKLVVVPEEAERVRHIMRRYLESANVFDLIDKLRLEGVVSKMTKGRDGTIRGGGPFTRGALYYLLETRFTSARPGTATRPIPDSTRPSSIPSCSRRYRRDLPSEPTHARRHVRSTA
jgi:putative AlgH/UPF0301 family transcriptional regulator